MATHRVAERRLSLAERRFACGSGRIERSGVRPAARRSSVAACWPATERGGIRVLQGVRRRRRRRAVASNDARVRAPADRFGRPSPFGFMVCDVFSVVGQLVGKPIAGWWTGVEPVTLRLFA